MLLALWGGFFEWGGDVTPDAPAKPAYIASSKKKPRRMRSSDMIASSFPEIDAAAARKKRNAAVFTILH